jgi:dGTPase
VDIADEIAYNNHDIDDGLSSEMLLTEALMEVLLFRENFEEAKRENPSSDFKVLKCQSILKIINRQATDLVETASRTIKEKAVESAEDVRSAGPLARFSPEMEAKNQELKRFLRENLYEHYRVLRMADKADRILKGLFELYRRDVRLLSPHFAMELERVDAERLICDYIAGMTDRFALDEYKKLFDPFEKV